MPEPETIFMVPVSIGWMAHPRRIMRLTEFVDSRAENQPFAYVGLIRFVITAVRLKVE
jgi:hypothetical protein